MKETLRVPRLQSELPKTRDASPSQPSRGDQVTISSRDDPESPLNQENRQSVQYSYAQYERLQTPWVPQVQSELPKKSDASQPSCGKQVTTTSRKDQEFPLNGENHQTVENSYTPYEVALGNRDRLYHEVLDDVCQGDSHAMLQQSGIYDVPWSTTS